MSRSAEAHKRGLPFCHPLAGDLQSSKAAQFVADTYPARERRHRLVVDAGCGQGRNTTFLLENGFRVVGLDISPRNLDVVRESPAAAKAAKMFVSHIVDLAGERIPVDDATVDAVLDVWVLGSVILQHDGRPGAKQYLTEIHRILKPDGILVSEFETLKPRRSSEGLHTYFGNLVQGLFSVVIWEPTSADYALHFEGPVRRSSGPALFVVASKE